MNPAPVCSSAALGVTALLARRVQSSAGRLTARWQRPALRNVRDRFLLARDVGRLLTSSGAGLLKAWATHRSIEAHLQQGSMDSGHDGRKRISEFQKGECWELRSAACDWSRPGKAACEITTTVCFRCGRPVPSSRFLSVHQLLRARIATTSTRTPKRVLVHSRLVRRRALCPAKF